MISHASTPTVSAVQTRPPSAIARQHTSDTHSNTGKQLASEGEKTATSTQPSPAKKPITQEDQRQLEQLKQRDREVRAHEQAHLSAAGSIAVGGASFSFKRGPDGQLYAVGGEVSIDTAKVPDDPQATLAKSAQIRRAALAPAEPSRQDRAIAAQAEQMAMQARAEILKEKTATPEKAIAQYQSAGAEAPGPAVDLYS